MTRIAYLLCTAIAIISGICLAPQVASAHAAAHIDRQALTTIPDKAKEAAKPTCIQTHTIERYAVSEGGRWQRVGGPITILEQCK